MDLTFLLENWFTLLISGLAAASTLLAYFIILRRKDVLRVHILAEFGDTFKTVKILKIPISRREFSFENKTYIIDLTKSVFDTKMHPHLYYRIDKPLPLSFNNTDQKLDTELLNTVVKSEVWRKMLSVGMMDKYMLILIIVLVIALACVAGAGYYFITKAAQQASQSTGIVQPVP